MQKRFEIKIFQAGYKSNFIVRGTSASDAYELAKDFYEDNSPVFAKLGNKLPYKVWINGVLVKKDKKLSLQFVDASMLTNMARTQAQVVYLSPKP